MPWEVFLLTSLPRLNVDANTPILDSLATLMHELTRLEAFWGGSSRGRIFGRGTWSSAMFRVATAPGTQFARFVVGRPVFESIGHICATLKHAPTGQSSGFALITL